MDGMCILQTLMMCFETFSEESQKRDAKTRTDVGNCGQAEDEADEGGVSPLSSSRVGKRRAQLLRAGNNHNLCWKKQFPNFLALQIY